MRLPLSWLYEFVDPGMSVDELAELLTIGGLEVEAIEVPSGAVRGVVIAEVRQMERIAESNKLHHVVINDGTTDREIVCGASNFAPGDRVVVALPGAVLPGPDDTKIDIGARTMLGKYRSEGMICSAAELRVGIDHRGIWVLDADAPIGADATEWLELGDAVLHIDVTPDRGYALSVLGIARDVAALTGAPLTAPTASAPAGGLDVPVEIVAPDRCLRFDARLINGVTIGPSPARVQRRLNAAGMRPRNNVVDATNYTLLELGNPIHAYDLARLAGPSISVRTAQTGETLRTLDGSHRTLDPDDLVIADAQGPVALAGVMGGEATEISATTTDVLLEVANFSPTTVLRSARRHGLATEGAKRWERVVPPESAPLAATRCTALITQWAGGAVTAGTDVYPAPISRASIRLRPARARAYLGVDSAAPPRPDTHDSSALDDARQTVLLSALGCQVTPCDTGDLDVTPPSWRPDLRIEVDLYEELLRLHGYDRITPRLVSTGQAGGRSPSDVARSAVRRAMAGGGWTEVMPMVFVAQADLAALQLPALDRRAQPVELVNPLSADEAVLRTTLLPGLLKVVRHNVNRQLADVAVFETGTVFLAPTADDPGADGGPDGVILPAEPLLLGFAATGAFAPARHDCPARAADIYDLLGAADLVRRAVGLDALDAEATDEFPYHPGRAARLSSDGAPVGVVGELHPRVCAAFEVPRGTLAGELRLDRLTAAGVRPGQPQTPSALPGLRFDVAVVVDDEVPAADVAAAIRHGAGPRCTEVRLFDVFRGPQIGEGRKSLAYSLSLDDAATQLSVTDEAAAIDAIEAEVAQRVRGKMRR